MLHDRPDWDSWFMALAFVVSQRSLDKHTRHGCVVVDRSRTILSVGYNGPPRGCIDGNIPLERPFKYAFLEHAESNSIVNAARCGTSLKDSIFYITGPPCSDCFRKILNVGAIKIVQGPILHKRTDDQRKAIEIMNDRGSESPGIEIVQFHDIKVVSSLLYQTSGYIDYKLKEQNSGKEESASSN